MFSVKKIAAVCAAGILSLNMMAAESTADSRSCADNFYNMGRGLVNIVTCWVEVPRCLIYHNSQLPVLGVVVGACQGAGFTAIRAFAGVADFASFGFMSDSIYESCHGFEEWVWDARWVPKK